jgi:ABC-2 type transport system ATP-binding protein
MGGISELRWCEGHRGDRMPHMVSAPASHPEELLMTVVLEIDRLTKTFRTLRHGPRRALDGFDMAIDAGQVHGFLGPNGSGKTTTLRTLLGLVGADSGAMRLFGLPVPQELPTVIDRVGAIVESPQFFGNFPGRRTLTLPATAGGVPVRRVDEVLELVGLRDRAGDRVKTYSLGMRQRLAVASALLKSPELLILDEPANGLDPAGIREMRDLMRALASTGATVLISSHLLDEVEQICDSVTIISRGRRVAAGPVADVVAVHDRGEYRVKVADLARAAEVLAGANLEAGPTVRVNGDHLIVSGVSDAASITETLGAHGLWVRELTPLGPDLEDVFLTITGTMPEPGLRRQVDDSVQPALLTREER